MREGKKKILCKSVQSMATLCGLRELRGIKIRGIKIGLT